MSMTGEIRGEVTTETPGRVAGKRAPRTIAP